MKFAYLALFCLAIGVLLTFVPPWKQNDMRAVLAAKAEECMPYYAVINKDGRVDCRSLMPRSFIAESPLPPRTLEKK